jgi:hypothetical protein
MSIDTEIDTVVSTFVADLVDLVRRAALDAVRSALVAQPASQKRARPPAARPAAAKPPSVEKPAAPAPARDDKLLGFLPVLAKKEEQQPKLAARGTMGPQAAPNPASARPTQLPVPRRFPPKRTRTRNPKPKPAAPPPPVAEAAPPGESPARKWVVVRRKASDRPESAVSDRPPAPAAAETPAEAAAPVTAAAPAPAPAVTMGPQAAPNPASPAAPQGAEGESG